MGLLRACDGTKDNPTSSGDSRRTAFRSDFPLGELTKEEVRALARRANPPARKSPNAWTVLLPNGATCNSSRRIHKQRGISLQNGEGEIVNETAT